MGFCKINMCGMYFQKFTLSLQADIKPKRKCVWHKQRYIKSIRKQFIQKHYYFAFRRPRGWWYKQCDAVRTTSFVIRAPPQSKILTMLFLSTSPTKVNQGKSFIEASVPPTIFWLKLWNWFKIKTRVGYI